jgi:hypothetical protein
VRYLARAAGYRVYLTSSEAVFTLDSPTGRAIPAVVRMELRDSSAGSEFEAVERLESQSHFFIGSDPEGWITHVPHYAKLVQRDVYPGIDLVYRGHGRQLEYDFVVAPGADPAAIQLTFAGAPVAETETGELVLGTAEAP